VQGLGENSGNIIDEKTHVFSFAGKGFLGQAMIGSGPFATSLAITPSPNEEGYGLAKIP